MIKFRKLFWLTILFNLFLVLPLKSYPQEPESVWTSPLKKCWEYKSEFMTNLKIASDNDSQILIPNARGFIESVSMDTGTLLWKTDVGGGYISEMDISKDSLFIITKRNHTEISEKTSQLNEIDIKTGIIKSQTDFQNLKNTFLSFHQTSFQITDRNGRIIYFDRFSADGWDKILESEIQTFPIHFDRRIIFGTQNKTVMFLSETDGTIKKQINLRANPSALAVSEKYLFAGDLEGNVYAFGLDSGNVVWHTKTGARIIELDIWRDSLIIISNDNFIYSVSAKSGNRIWKKRLEGRINGKAYIDSEYAVFSPNEPDSLHILNLRNGKTINKIDFGNNTQIVSPPIYDKRTLFVPTKEGIIAYSPVCK